MAGRPSLRSVGGSVQTAAPVFVSKYREENLMRRGVNDHGKGGSVRTTSVVFLLVAICVLGLASQASAAGRLGSYLALKGGIYSPSASFSLKNVGVDRNTFDADTKAGLDGEIAVGHFFLPTLALELGAGYFKGKGSFATTPVHDVKFNVIPIIVTAKALIPVGSVDPYGEVGIGAYFTKVTVTENLNNFSGTATFGLHAGAGLNINLSPNAFLGVEGRYVTANPSFGDEKIKLNDTEYALNGFKLNGFTTTAVLGFSF
jgi:outer membrane protein W